MSDLHGDTAEREAERVSLFLIGWQLFLADFSSSRDLARNASNGSLFPKYLHYSIDFQCTQWGISCTFLSKHPIWFFENQGHNRNSSIPILSSSNYSSITQLIFAKRKLVQQSLYSLSYIYKEGGIL
jgi:hypothetical protein